MSAAEQPLARVSIDATQASRPEGRAGTTPFTFTLSRAGNLDVPAEVSFAVAGTGAHPAAAADFTGGAFPAGTVTLEAGEARRTLTVEVAADTVAEESDSFAVTIATVSPDVTVGTGLASTTILDDDSFTDLLVMNTVTQSAPAVAPRFYDGPVAGLEKEIIMVTAENLAVMVTADN